PMLGGFQRGSEQPLEAEVVLVDEASMLNLQLASSLLEAIAPSTRVILVGDVDQLPPVGAGQVLRELIASEVGAVVRLEEVFRQAAESAIVQGAHAILRGDVPTSTPTGAPIGPGDLFVVKARDPDRIRELLLGLMKRIEERYGIDPVEGVQVLTPMRRGPLGTEGLNELLQEALNPKHDPKRRGAFVPGDKVMQLRNDYDKDVFNGDLGRVHRVQGGMTFVRIDGREIQYKVEDLDALSLAYASTIHKVQGSEFPAVVVVLHGAHHVLLSRALVYTAVTRAQRLAILLGDPAAIARASRNALSYESNSRLARRLREGPPVRADDVYPS
ncbi:MAG: AAA family ATPase, partial [Myxococcota bacterium]